ncbi:MAG: hypothetical protein KDE09_26525, partial [Anaerolineales bacterium]|nr:hypothetical protein [Anaerolineales bacterium]
MTIIEQAAVIGGGVIGAGWAARLIENGIDVAVYDPAPDAEAKMQAVLANADRAYEAMTSGNRAPKGRLRFFKSIG